MQKILIGDTPVTLKADEKIIWQGRPVQGLIRNPVLIGLGVVFLGLGLWLAIGGFGPLAAAGVIPGLPFIGIGAYLAYFHARAEEKRRAATFYALTNQRAVLVYGPRALAYPILPESKITLKKARYDVVNFAAERKLGAQNGARWRRVGFADLENGDEVYTLMRGIQKNPDIS